MSSKHEGDGARQRALAELQYNKIITSDLGNSSDDDEVKHNNASQDLEDAREAIGVSIGREQSRLVSPSTPAAEKAAALEREGGLFGSNFDGIPEGDEADNADEELGVQRSQVDEVKLVKPSPDRSLRPGDRLPSPWRVNDKAPPPRSSKSRSVLRDGFSFRRRASSGPDQPISESFGKSFFASFPSMPKNFSISSPFSSMRDTSKDSRQNDQPRGRSARASSMRDTPMSPSRTDTRDIDAVVAASRNQYNQEPKRTKSPKEHEEAQATVGALPGNADLQLHQVRSRPQPLRRVTSDTSLITQRTMSRVSSLGDDSRFENVSEQVNSRFKAIKDSFQDSSIKLPSMSSISNFSHFTGRDRSSSDVQDKPTHKPEDPMTRRPYSSAKSAMHDTPQHTVDHPHFTEALENLEGDIVVLGGYRGSILRSAEPPHRQLWVPIKVGLNIRKVDLEVGIEEDSDEKATDKIIPGGMLTHIGPVDMSRRLFKKLRASENAKSGKLRVHDYGYDWRLHPAHLSKQMIQFLESLPCNQPGVSREQRGATVIAHSLGGLITRHAVNQRPELFKGVVYAGVPQTCVNILGPLRNGDEVLLSSRVLTAQVNFTIRTSFALLPLNGRCFVDKNTKEEYPVDFFDPQTWIDCRLSPVVARPLPSLNPPPKPSGLSGYVNSVANALESLPRPGRKNSSVRGKSPGDLSSATMAAGAEVPDSLNHNEESSRIAMANGNIDDDEVEPPSVRTAVTIPHDKAVAYLTRTLRTVKKFKEELAFRPEHHAANAYPPISAIYGKTTPTVIGAKVDGREGIKHADAYDELAFASGDGVVLARAAMVPEGYHVARGGVHSSERGHVTLLGDLEAVGKCLNAIYRARSRGIGLGK